MDTILYYFHHILGIAIVIFGILETIAFWKWVNWLFDKKKYDDVEDKND